MMTRYLLSGAALAAGMTIATALVAQDAAQVVNPQLFNAIPLDRSALRLEAAPAVALDRRTSREVRLEMDISYLDRTIYNPATGNDDPVRLRGYSDALGTGTPSTALVGPTIEVSPGQTARIKLNNKMPEDQTCNMGKGGSINTPHCFNGTNLHTHGLWVNPAGNGDNVLISIRPGVSFEYEYAIPDDHPAGTFWYHPHLHGSTALQVSSGMSGAIIIRDDRAPVPNSDGGFARPGDLDRLLMDEDMQPIPERILVLQQIQYACRDEDGNVQTNADGEYICNKDQVGGIEGYDQFGPKTWPKSGRYTSVNGEVRGRLAQATVGVPERWRMIHAGVRDTINFEIRPRIGEGPFRAISSAETDNWIEENCGPALGYHVVAQDGLTMAAAQPRDQAILQPGYRVDALVTFPEAGEYCVVDGDAPAVASIGTPEPSRRLLGVVTATGSAPAGTGSAEWLTEWLMAAAERTMPGDVVAQVQSDLADGLKLTAFVPHADIPEDEVTGTQELTFNIDLSLPGAALFEIDGKPYDANRVDRLLALGDVEQWNLRSDFDGHPFHIHVNPFQVVEILNADGVDVSALGSEDGGDPQYGGLKGVWKDTLWVKNTGQTADTQYTVVVRTRYQRYIGEFVLHCHILDHEDQGMMQNVKIALPDGSGGVAMAHH